MADTDLLTLSEAQDAIGAPGNSDYDPALSQAVTAVTALIETKVGPIVKRTITGELHNGGDCSVLPYKRPIASVSSVIEARWTTLSTLTAETFGTAPTNGYLFDPTTGEIHRRQGGWSYYFWPGQLNVKITYVAGRYDTTDDVDARFKEAAKITLAHNWGLDNGSGNATFGTFDGTDVVPTGRGWALPNRALELLADDRRVPGDRMTTFTPAGFSRACSEFAALEEGLPPAVLAGLGEMAKTTLVKASAASGGIKSTQFAFKKPRKSKGQASARVSGWGFAVLDEYGSYKKPQGYDEAPKKSGKRQINAKRASYETRARAAARAFGYSKSILGDKRSGFAAAYVHHPAQKAHPYQDAAEVVIDAATVVAFDNAAVAAILKAFH